MSAPAVIEVVSAGKVFANGTRALRCIDLTVRDSGKHSARNGGA